MPQDLTRRRIVRNPCRPALDRIDSTVDDHDQMSEMLMNDTPEEALTLFREVLLIDPQRLEVNSLMGAAYAISAGRAPSSRTFL